MDDGDGRDAALRRVERIASLARDGAARLHAQERRHGLQVILHPVIDLADRGVFRHEFALLAAQLADVAAQDDGALAGRAVKKRNGAEHHHHVVTFDLGHPRRPTHEHERQRFVDLLNALKIAGHELGENRTDDRLFNAEAAKVRDRVRRGIQRLPARVHVDQTVRDAWRAVAVARRRSVDRELTALDHPRKITGHRLIVGEHLRGNPIPALGCHHGHHSDHAVLMPHGHKAQVERFGVVGKEHLLAGSVGVKEPLLEPLLRVAAHEIRLVNGGRRTWAGLRCDSHLVAVDDVENKVGKGDVGDNLPIAGQLMQPVALRGAEVGGAVQDT